MEGHWRALQGGTRATCECVASSKLVDGPTQEVSTPPHAPSVKGPQSKKGGLPSELAHSRRPTGLYQVVVKQRDDVSCCKEGYLLKLKEMNMDPECKVADSKILPHILLKDRPRFSGHRRAQS